MKSSIQFATAGIPVCTPKRDTLGGLEQVRKLGLDGMELEFVHGVNMKEQTAGEVKTKAEQLGLSLSVHGPYYINLNAAEADKQLASEQRIFESARIGAMCGAAAITFHPAYVMKSERPAVAQKVLLSLESILEQMNRQKIKTQLKPETTGKETQFGSLTELLELHSKNPRIEPNVDFSHLHARDNGRFRKKEDFRTALIEIETCDSKLLKSLHMHVSGIAYTAKGERNHLELEDPKNDFNYKWLLETLRDFEVNGRIVCESPNIEIDAQLMQKYYQNLR